MVSVVPSPAIWISFKRGSANSDSITQTWPRHPVAIASQCLAMAQLAPGRFRIGLGPSHQPAIEGMYGYKYQRPLKNLREYLYTVQGILKQGEVDFAGEFVTTKARLGGGPGNVVVEAPIDVPVMASALRPPSFRLCGELADGAISWVCPWDYLRDIAAVEVNAVIRLEPYISAEIQSACSRRQRMMA